MAYKPPPPNPSLLPLMLFVPRQVTLASSSAAAAAAAAMAKVEPKKEKKSKTKAAKLSSSSSAAAAPDARVVAAVAAFLESSGFPRALAALQSEADIEVDAWRSSPVSLGELVSKFLESSDSAPGAGVAATTEQEKTPQEEEAREKKKKKKDGVVAVESESKVTETSAPEKTSEDADGQTKEKKLDGKKKKSKKHEKDEDVEARLEKVESAVIFKFEATKKLKADGKKLKEEEPKSQNDDAEKNGLVDGAPLEKGKKKKKGKSAPDTSDKIDGGTTAAGADGAKGKSDAVETEKDDNEKKTKKKRKKSGSDENVQVESKEVSGKDSVPKSDGGNKSGMEIDIEENEKLSNENAVVGKKRKLEEVEGSNPPAKESSTADQKLTNGFSEDDAKPSKRQKHSSEPKTVNAFQRVKLENVKFADERLQDNSYWAKSGADSGYGAKAQEILGQVRGRGFRHEKTKKKRGSYRGGQIDLQTHSIKFDNSDDE